MTKAELIFYEMTDREIFSRAKTVYEKLGMSEKGLLSVMRPTMGAVTILSVDLTNKIRDAVSMQYDDFLADDYIERAKKIQNEMNEKREEGIKEQKVSNSYIDKFNKEVQDSDNDFEWTRSSFSVSAWALKEQPLQQPYLCVSAQYW